MSVVDDTEHRLRVLQLLNDNARRYFVGIRVVITASIAADHDLQANLLCKVRLYDDFSAKTDPDRDHSAGEIEHAGETFLWRIAYYDPTMEYGSEDPADPHKTVRALTLMRPCED